MNLYELSTPALAVDLGVLERNLDGMIIPNHVCTCVNMHDEAFLVRDEQVVGSWRIAARGKIR